MGTIPVGQAIGGAYGFLFRRFFTILGLSWLPAAIYALGRLGFLWHVEPPLYTDLHAHTHPSAAIVLLALGYVLFSGLMKSAIALPLNRDALGLYDQPVLARLVVGTRELRLLAAYIGIAVILILLLVALAFGVMGATWAAKWAVTQNASLANWPVAKIVHIAASVIAILFFFFVALRLFFLIAPVTAAEDRARLSRAWELSAGNFWRMLAIFIVLALPLLVVAGLCEYAVMGSGFRDLHRDHGAVLALAIQHGPAMVTIVSVFMVVILALFAGAGSVAYRALVPQPRREAEVYVEPVETQTRVEPYAESAHEPESVVEEAPHAEETAPVHEDAVVAEDEHVVTPAEEAPHEPHAAESSHEAAGEAPAMELGQPVAPEEAHEAETLPPPPVIAEDPGWHGH